MSSCWALLRFQRLFQWCPSLEKKSVFQPRDITLLTSSVTCDLEHSSHPCTLQKPVQACLGLFCLCCSVWACRCSSWLNVGCTFLSGMPQKKCYFLLRMFLRRDLVLISPINGDSNLELLVTNWCRPGFSTVISKYYLGRILGVCKIVSLIALAFVGSCINQLIIELFPMFFFIFFFNKKVLFTF